MKSLGALFVFAIIAIQVVAAIVAAVKKQQAGAGTKTGRPPGAPSVPTESSASSAAARREELIARRRQQIEELRARAKSKVESKAQSKGQARTQANVQDRTGTTRGQRAPKPPARAPKAPVPVREPVAMPSVAEEEPALLSALERPVSPHLESAYARKKPGEGRKIAKLLRNRSSLRDAIILKELLDPPISLRTNGGDLS